MKFYSQFIGNGDLCFDVGAHTGSRSSAWLGLDAKVVALEPQPALTKLMQKKFHSNTHITILVKAVGDKPGKKIFKIAAGNPSIATFSRKWINLMHTYHPQLKWDKCIETEITTLDNLIEEYGMPAFCKIDVEGYEEHVFYGLTNCLPAISFEFFPDTVGSAVNCIIRLENLGSYEYNWSFRESFRFNSMSWLTADQMIKAMQNYTGKKSGDIYARLKSK